ncbi:hypothetical protein ACFLWI_02795 [Chloroflexota bacterium]
MFSLNIPEYESSALRFISDVLQGFLSVDPLFSGIERDYTTHRGPIRNVPGDTPLDQSMFTVSGESSLSWESIHNGKIDDYIHFLVDISESQRKSLAKHFFRNISEITDVTGQSLDAKGQPLTVDLILDLLEKVEFGFDEDGNPQYPTLVLPPAAIERLKTLEFTPEQEQRRTQIIEEKRARFNASKRTRRLS